MNLINNFNLKILKNLKIALFLNNNNQLIFNFFVKEIDFRSILKMLEIFLFKAKINNVYNILNQFLFMILNMTFVILI